MKHRHFDLHQGFTVIEQIIVVVVIGILASIVIISFGPWRDRTAQNEVKNDLMNVQSAMDNARTWNNGYPTIASGTTFDGADASTQAIYTQSTNVTLTYYSGNAQTYCINAVSKARSSVKMYLNAANGNKTPQTGTCP